MGITFIPNGDNVRASFARTTHLAISAHQDDIEFMAYSAIAECYDNPAKHFTAVVVTNGSGSPRSNEYAKYTDAEMVAVRIEEQKNASVIGKYNALKMLMLPSDIVRNPARIETVTELEKIFLESTPEIVYTHNLADKHPTHVAVAVRVITAMRKLPPAKRPKKVYGCEVWRALDWLQPDDKVLLDTSPRPEVALELMQVFKSQIAGGKKYDTATAGRRLANATFLDDHAVDKYESVQYAMDLTPLITDEKLDIAKFVTDYIDRFKQDVTNKIKGAE